MEAQEIPEPVPTTDSDDEPVNIETDTVNDVDASADVALLDLEPTEESSPPEVSLEDPPPPPESEVVSPPSRHHRRSRSRSRSRRHPSWLRSHNNPSRGWRLKKKESNFVAAACSMIVLVLMCTAMAEPQWIYIKGGGCRQNIQNTPVHYLGLNQFFYLGDFKSTDKGHDDSYTYYKYGPNPDEGLIDCVTPQAIGVIRSMIALCSIGAVFTILAFLLDLHGPSLCALKTLQRHAILSMCTVGICVAICGFCYWTTQLVKALQLKTKPLVGSKVVVQFSIGFYLITAAGSVAVIAAGCNLLRRPSAAEEEDDDRERLMHDADQGYPPQLYGDSMGLMMPPPPPPPPYQP